VKTTGKQEKPWQDKNKLKKKPTSNVIIFLCNGAVESYNIIAVII
jgi:hypothetical protein